MIRFYAPDIESSGILPEPESGHACRVLRLREGDTIHAVDGKGHSFVCELTDANPRAAGVRIVERVEEPRAWMPRITLAVAPTKHSDRMEWLVEKCVEMGVDRIVLLECERSERRVFKAERLRKIAVSAMKQSLKATLPEISEMTKFRDFLKQELPEKRYMGYCDAKYPRIDFVKDYDGASDLVVLIGPEGDFSEGEVEAAVGAGFLPVTFGRTRLRTETAALYAVAAVHVMESAAE